MTTPNSAPEMNQQPNMGAPKKGLLASETVGGWFVNMLLEGILTFIWPIVILVSSNQSESRKNYAKARLIWMAIAFVLVILLSSTILATLASSIPSM